MPSIQRGFRLVIPVLLLIFFLITYRAISNRDVSDLKKSIQEDVPNVKILTYVNVSPTSLSWQKMFTDFYFYSIYPTVYSEEIHAIIIGPRTKEPIRKFWKLTVCHCAYHSGNEEPRSLIRGFLEPLEDFADDSLNMMGGRVRCPFPENVQNSSEKYPFVDFRCENEGLSGVLTFPTPDAIRQLPPKMSFAHCGAPIWGRVERPAGIVEFIEYYRLMGISKFFWYDMDASNRTRDVLRYYQNKGVMHLTKWILPWTQSSGKVIHYYGQLAALYDCAMKTSATHDYTVVSDVDEFFVTSTKWPSFSHIMDNGSTDCVRVRSVFMDPNANYNDAFDPQSGQPRLITATITRRTTTILAPDYRTKYICRMQHADNPMIHTIGGLRGVHVMENLDPEKALLLHFRSFGSRNQALTNETRATTRTNELQGRVSEVWQEIFG